jgi:hypothetical protein
VLSVGLASLARLQLWLWTSVDASRQQGEASRLAQQDLESLRAWLALAPGGGARPSYAAVTGQASSPAGPASGSSTAYELERRVLDGPPDTRTSLARYKTVATTLRWVDREGARRELTLPGLIAGLDPFWSAALRLAPGQDSSASAAAAPAPPRHPLIPADAVALADGRLAWKIAPASDLAWLFDRASGRITQRCSTTAGLTAGALGSTTLAGCVALAGLPVWGAVRFATTSIAAPTRAELIDPPSAALDLDLRLTLTGSPAPISTPGWECEDNSAAAVAAAALPGVVRFLCVVQAGGTPPRWSGRLDLVPVGWTLGGTAPGALRVCRYSADQNGNGRIDNAEHPAAYAEVDQPLGQQNFLVVPAALSCPVDSPGDPATDSSAGLLRIDFSTQAHQP